MEEKENLSERLDNAAKCFKELVENNGKLESQYGNIIIAIGDLKLFCQELSGKIELLNKGINQLREQLFPEPKEEENEPKSMWD